MTKNQKKTIKKQKSEIKWFLDMFGCDAVMLESCDENFVNVSPYNTKTKNWVCGMNYITTWNEVLGWDCLKVCKENDIIANKKLKEFYEEKTYDQKNKRK